MLALTSLRLKGSNPPLPLPRRVPQPPGHKQVRGEMGLQKIKDTLGDREKESELCQRRLQFQLVERTLSWERESWFPVAVRGSVVYCTRHKQSLELTCCGWNIQQQSPSSQLCQSVIQGGLLYVQVSVESPDASL